jgi:UDP-2-acetamido-2,6-beta-L-arabino-hexul-4-ose reductase
MMIYELHNNQTGSFQELVHSSDVKFGQLSLLTINPGCNRGGHYHTRKEEWFCCIHGNCELMLLNIHDNTSKKTIMDGSKREFIKVKPYEKHFVKNLSDQEECEILIIISEEYDPNDSDTFT